MSNSKLNTKDIKPSGPSGPSKALEAGNQQCKIHGIELEEFKLKPGAYHIIMHMEGPDLGPSFEGWFKNKDDESLGRYKGAVGKVKAGEWAYADGTTKTGVEVSRDQEILKFIKTLCTALGKDAMKWLEDQDDKHDTIESLVKTFNNDQPFKDKYLNYCLGAREWKDKNGYIRHDLFIPKFSKNGIPFEAIGAKPSKLVRYSEVDHLRKLKVTEVPNFGGSEDAPLEGGAKTDFAL